MLKEGILYRYLVVLRAVLYSAFDLLNWLFPCHCHTPSTVPEVYTVSLSWPITLTKCHLLNEIIISSQYLLNWRYSLSAPSQAVTIAGTESPLVSSVQYGVGHTRQLPAITRVLGHNGDLSFKEISLEDLRSFWFNRITRFVYISCLCLVNVHEGPTGMLGWASLDLIDSILSILWILSERGRGLSFHASGFWWFNVTRSESDA